MTRGIKFRAIGWALAFTLEDILYEEDLREYLAKEKPIIRRCTGLKDKKGVEVYEGDIVKTVLDKHVWHYLIRSHDNTGTNLYKDTIYRNFTGGGSYEPIEWGDFRVNEVSNSMLYFNRFSEVIGNIYENPELMERQ